MTEESRAGVPAVGFVPGAPLLVPAVAGGAAHLDDALRAASLDVVRQLIETGPAEIVVVAPVAAEGDWPVDATWDFVGFGVPRADAPAAPRLPWALGIGAWLLDQAGWTGRRRFIGVAAANGSAPTRLANGAALLAIGDGTACRTEKAPGHLDPRARAFDAAVAACLTRGDVAALAAIDGPLAAELMCGGAPVWRWVATQLAGRSVAAASLAADVAPYGVAYFVASWTLA